MVLDIQFKLKENPYALIYLRENSYWYRILNRNPLMYNSFINEVKEKYKLRTTDRISKALSTIELLENIVSNIN